MTEFSDICDQLIKNIDNVIFKVVLKAITSEGDIIKTFDRVLVRNKDTDDWSIDIFIHFNHDGSCITEHGTFEQCIRFESNEILRGTNQPSSKTYYFVVGNSGVYRVHRGLEKNTKEDIERKITGNFFRDRKTAVKVAKELEKVWSEFGKI